MEPIEATAPITITFTAMQWSQALNVLAEGPYRIVAPLIAEITAQAEKQGNGVGAMHPRPNGADHRAHAQE